MDPATHPFLYAEPHPEAMADVPGVCDLPLTRAIIQYRDRHEMDRGGRIQDIGLGLVLEGRYAASAAVVDLGQGEVKDLDLSTELVVLDWVYEPTLEHVRWLVESRNRARSGDRSWEGEAQRYCFDLALRVLTRLGYSPITRPSVLRIGFRDVCRDLDLHEGTAVRVVAGAAGVIRVHLDYDSVALVVRTGLSRPDHTLERMLEGSFPAQDVRRILPSGPAAALGYQVRFQLPLTLSEARRLLHEMRLGLGQILAGYEPERHEAVQRLLDTFGTRDTLARLKLPDLPERTAPLRPVRSADTWRVH